MVDENSEELEDVKFTFFTKDPLPCPVCGSTFKREEMLTGRGRLIAGKLTLELRRLYEPSKKFGDLIKPLIYPVTVCPNCLFAAVKEDFDKVDKKLIEKAQENTERRRINVNKIFPGLDFSAPRELDHGAASYLLAVEGYSYFDKWASPTLKKAICSLRAAWLFGDMETLNPDKSQYGELSNFFYKKSLFFYQEAIDRWQKGLEAYDGAKNFGPDLDKNWGYDGVLYLIGYLTNKFSVLEKDSLKRKTDLENAKRIISKMFGSGKVSKDKPTAILDMTRDLYDEMSVEIARLEEELTAQGKTNAPTPEPPAETDPPT